MADSDKNISPKKKKIAIIATVSCFSVLTVGVIVAVVALPTNITNELPDGLSNVVWEWKCVNQRCEKHFQNLTSNEEKQSLSACKMLCDEWGNMWPRPTSNFSLGKKLTHVDIDTLHYQIEENFIEIKDFLTSAINRFHSHIKEVIPDNYKVIRGGLPLKINFIISNKTINLDLNTDESYKIDTNFVNSEFFIEIEAENYFGARHALESLEQFVIFDDINSKTLFPESLHIDDKPIYPYRGLLLDTARNFFSVESIKRTLDGMAACKLNRFHWHITDSQSIPIQFKSHPELTEYGAFSPTKIYQTSEIIDVVSYGLERGIKVIPEFDAPSHVGEGWQKTDYLLCFNIEPWDKYCYEPPCGIFDPTKDTLYDMLEDIYRDMFDIFKPDIFHMGGDEVKFECWNETDSVKAWMEENGMSFDKEGYLNLWKHFQDQAADKVYKVNNGNKLPLILWTSTLTEFENIEKYISKDDYIIQVWTEHDSIEIKGLLDKGYRLIMSNYDALYLDCGFGAWVQEGNNWCSPYKGWHTVYSNSLEKIAGGRNPLILGGEAALWSEQVDSYGLDGRIWPRAGALAERLWAEPNSSWIEAERRILEFRERLIKLNIAPDGLQPAWCHQNEGRCFLDETIY